MRIRIQAYAAFDGMHVRLLAGDSITTWVSLYRASHRMHLLCTSSFLSLRERANPWQLRQRALLSLLDRLHAT